MPPLVVDRSSPVPLYFQVASQLERLIESGELPPGTRLENEIALADALGVSRPTMRSAIAYLVDRGLLRRRRGIGTEVLHPKVRRPAELTSLYDDLTKSGREPRTELLSFGREPAGEGPGALLELAPEAEVYVLRRLRYAGDEPLALMNNYLPVDLLHLTPDDLARRGLYDLLRTAGISLETATQTIGAKTATAAEARSLGESRGAALLTMARTAYDATGRPVEHGFHLYRASRYTFELTLTGLAAPST